MPPKKSSTPTVNEPMRLIAGISDWRSYIDALEQCNQWWENRTANDNHPFSVLGEQQSWLETIQVLHKKVKQGNWDKLGKHGQDQLLGLSVEGGNWALLGRMRQESWDIVFSNDDDREMIENAVLSIVGVNDKNALTLIYNAYKKLIRINGIGQGIATRLLTLARPDRCVSMNDASIKRLTKAYGDGFKELGYGEILAKIHAQPWYQEPEPEDEWERNIWQMRVALLDCFVYQPTR